MKTLRDKSNEQKPPRVVSLIPRIDSSGAGGDMLQKTNHFSFSNRHQPISQSQTLMRNNQSPSPQNVFNQDAIMIHGNKNIRDFSCTDSVMSYEKSPIINRKRIVPLRAKKSNNNSSGMSP